MALSPGRRPVARSTGRPLSFEAPPSSVDLLTLDYDGTGEEAFWSADVRYPLARLRDGTISVFAGWGGLSSGTIAASGPRLGAAFDYRLAFGNRTTPLYITGCFHHCCFEESGRRASAGLRSTCGRTTRASDGARDASASRRDTGAPWPSGV